MERDKIYILNPAYYLRNDEKRALLGSYDNVSTDCVYTKSLFTIHPLVAQMLSFFDGYKTLGTVIQELANYFNLTREEVNQIIERYIENTIWAGSNEIEYKVNIPQNVLVEKGKYQRSEFYTP